MNRLPLYLNELNYKNKLKVKSFKILRTSFFLRLSSELEKYGFILKFKSYSFVNKFKVNLSYTNNTKPVFQIINIFYKLNRALSFSYVDIISLKKKVNYGIFFFSTDYGILSDLDCVKKKIGGILIFWIF